jgi:hypothetical protein
MTGLEPAHESCGVPKRRYRRWAGLLRGSFVLGGEPAEYGSALDPLVCQVGSGTVGPWRLRGQCSVWPSAVVVAGEVIEGSAWVSFAEDQHVVGDLGAGR